MTVTDELRKMLTERGIEWRWEDERTTYWYGTFDGREWCEWTAIEYDGYLRITCADCGELLTPEQAIEATLGRGECHEVEDEDTGFIVCSECGAVHDADYTNYYCWCCGAKVVTS